MRQAPLILVSDDEPFIISALRRLARAHGLEVIGDTRGERIHQIARDTQPDLIVLDINQPVDGRDVLAHLKSDPLTRDVPVIVLSAVEDQFTRLTCLELGAADYAVKPLDVAFVAKLVRMTRARGSPPTLQPRGRVVEDPR
jgi:CheY-like chemotaxis protein